MQHQEIERKFVLEQVPQQLLQGSHGEKIRQGYLLYGERELRIRERAGRCTMTVKQGSGLARLEQECAIEQQQFDMLWPLTEGMRIEKVRYAVKQGELIFEIDIFAGRLAPLQLLEVEFPDREASTRFIVPDFIACEVTADNAYKNASLARNGRP